MKRNALGAANAIASVEMALAGCGSVFSADSVIEAMGKVGRRLPEEFRETARGGLAALPLEGPCRLSGQESHTCHIFTNRKDKESKEDM